MTIIMPMGGASTRLGSPSPSKPFTLIDGTPMYLHAMYALPPSERRIVVLRQEEEHLCNPEGEHAFIKCVEEEGRGVVEAVKGALPYALEGSVLIAHADQVIDWSPAHFARYCERRTRPVVPVALHHTHQAGAAALDGNAERIVAITPKVSSEFWGLCGVYYFPSRSVCHEALEGLGETDLIGGQHYIECGLRRLIQKGFPVDYYPVRRVYMLDTVQQIAEFERNRYA